MKIARVFTAAAFATAFAVTTASAQPQGVPVIGQIQGVDGNLLVVKTQAGEQKVALANNVAVWGLEKASVSDVAKGAFIGVGATPQADGSQKAIRVIIFAEPMRGQGDGHRPGWYGTPNGTMTNGAVEPTGTVGAATPGAEPTFLVKYKEGEKRIVVPANAHIVRYEVGNKGDLKAGAPFSVQAAAKQADGTYTSPRINVGKDGGRPF